jgi:hypothetical protein
MLSMQGLEGGGEGLLKLLLSYSLAGTGENNEIS